MKFRVVIPEKRFKLDVTRPEFLIELMGCSGVDELTTGIMKRVICKSGPLAYCVYTVLMEADIQKKDIKSIHNDNESIAIVFKSKIIQ